MRINETDGNAKIKQAYMNAVPDICDEILSDCKNENGKVIMMTENRKKRNIVKYMMVAASLLVVLGAGTLLFNIYHMNYAVASTVSLDVNPSIQITVNEKERVLDVKALNKDGGIVIGDMDFSGSDIDVTVNALIGSMLRKGYLNELANSILISVDNSDPAASAALQKRLTQEVNELMESDGFFGAVLGQTLNNDNSLQQQADLYGISLGKAQLIQQILDSTTGHTFEDLAPLSINELNLLIAAGASEIEQVSSLGNASDKAYIGEEKAKEAAYAHAKVTASDVTFCKVDMDVEKGVMVYEIDFKCDGYEYEYDVDAQTGSILKSEKEIDDDAPKKTGTTAAGTGNGSADAPQGEDGNASAGKEQQTLETPAVTGPVESVSPAGTQIPPQTGHHDEYHNVPPQTGTDASELITLEKAKEIALNHAGQTADSVIFKKAKLDYDDGMQLYEIEFDCGMAEYEYEINALTGAIWTYKREDEHHNVPAQPGADTSGLITLEQAKEIALNHAGQTAGSVVFKKAELDYDDGIQLYEIEFDCGRMEYEYEINASTGAVWDYEWDYDD